MRKLLVIALTAILTLTLAGCGGSYNSNPGGGGGTSLYDRIPFETVKPGEEPAAVASELEQMKAKAGTKTVVVDGATYAIVTAGEKPSGGYDVEIISVGDTGGQIKVAYEVKEPKPGTGQTAVISYPSAVVKFENQGNLPVRFVKSDEE